MGIVDKIEAFVNETKEMSLKKVEKKIKDGYWEAEQDLKVGKHATLRDTKTNKRIVVYITEDLDEGKSSLIVSAVKKDIGLSEKQFKIAHLTGNIESPKNNDKCVIVFKNNGKPKFKVYTFDSSNKWVPGEVFTDSNKLKSLWKDFPNVDYNLNEEFDDSELEEINEATFAQHMKKAIAAKERGDEKKTIYHLGNAKTARYAMKSTEISKNKELLDKYKEMTKNLIESELDEAAKMPLTLKIGDSFKTDEGSIKITDITVSSLHMNPITYITYKYDVVIDGKPLRGEEKASLNSFKDHFKK